MKCLSIIAGVLVTVAAVASLMLTASAESGSGTTVVGIDADPSGNTATSLGTIDRCIEVSVGQTFDIDVFVDAIPEDRDLAGFNYLLNYDPSKLQVNVCNHEMLLASEPGSYVVDVSEVVCRVGSPPDTDGTLLVGAADLKPGAHEPGGSLGVLGRYQLEAVGAGTSVLILEPFVGGGIVADSSPAFIPVDEIHDGNWTPRYGIIAVDSDMDGDGASDCEDPDIDGDGFLNSREENRGSNPLDAGSTPEECDGLDNDGDTLVDDGWPNADGDGLADCLDPDMDTDGDGIANPDDPDDDNDGFTDEREIFMGLSSLDACGVVDAWAPDIDNNGKVTIVDVLKYKPVIRSKLGVDVNYDRRYDLNANGEVNIVDVLMYKPFINKFCTDL
jgi:hypothetical protein